MNQFCLEMSDEKSSNLDCKFNLLSLYQTKCASKYQDNPRMAQVPKAINYVQTLYTNSSVREDNEEFKELVSKCESAIELGDNLLSNLLELASFLKQKQTSKDKPSVNGQPKSPELMKKTPEKTIETNSLELCSNSKNDTQEKTPATKKDKKKIGLKELTKVDSISVEQDSTENSKLTPKKDVNDEVEASTSNAEPSEHDELKDLSKEDMKRLERIKKLDTYCMNLNRKIIEIENEEITHDDLDKHDSNYLVECELKKRFVKAYKVLVSECKKHPHLVSNDVPVPKTSGGQFSKKVKFNFTRYKEINTHVMNCLNKNRQFPDYCEILEWVTTANNQHKLGLDDKRVSEISTSSFEYVCKILKSRRITDERQIQMSRIESLKQMNGHTSEENEVDNDPAEKDKQLETVLAENKKLADQKYEEVINSFVVKQENNEDFEVDDKSVEEEDDDEEQPIEINDDEDIGSIKESIDTETLDESCNSLESDNDELNELTDNMEQVQESTETTNANAEQAKEATETNKENIEQMPTEALTSELKESNKKPIKRTSEESSDNKSKKFKPEGTDDSNDSMKLRPRRNKPTIVECTSAVAQSSDECIVLD